MEQMTAMSGRAAMELGARLGGLGVLAIGSEGGELARMLARTAGCGAALAGADVLFHDGTNPAAGAWLAQHYALPAALCFQEEGGRVSVWLHDGQGRPMDRDRLPLAGGWAGPVGRWDRLVGTDDSFAAHRVGRDRTPGLAVTVMPGPGQGPLIAAMERLGCEVLSRPRVGVPLLRCDRAGFRLTAVDGMDSRELEGRDALAAAVDWCLRREGAERSLPAFGRQEIHEL